MYSINLIIYTSCFFGISILVINIFLSLELKRIMFLTTLYLQLQDIGIVEPKTLEQLNKKFHLATKVEALEFSKKIYKKVWDNKLEWLKLCITKNYNDRDFANNLISITPKFFRYGRKEMVDDIHMIFNS